MSTLFIRYCSGVFGHPEDDRPADVPVSEEIEADERLKPFAPPGDVPRTARASSTIIFSTAFKSVP